jgi:hypothetical protein
MISPDLNPAWSAGESGVTHSMVVVLISYFGTSLIHAEVEDHQHKCQDEVGRGAGQADEHALPAGMVEERAGIVWRICRFSAGRLEVLLRGLAGHFDVAAQGKQADFVVGFAVLEAEEARPEADGKRLDATPQSLARAKWPNSWTTTMRPTRTMKATIATITV